MNKEIYLVQGADGESYPEFKSRIYDLARKAVNDLNPDRLKFTITVRTPPAIKIIPFRRNKIAAISICKSNQIPVDNFLKTSGFYGAYRVTEAEPVAYLKDWKDGEPTPGACLLTLFSRKKNIDYETFIHRWHNGHTPLSLRIHPLWNYVRNVVDESIMEDSVPFDGMAWTNDLTIEFFGG